MPQFPHICHLKSSCTAQTTHFSHLEIRDVAQDHCRYQHCRSGFGPFSPTGSTGVFHTTKTLIKSLISFILAFPNPSAVSHPLPSPPLLLPPQTVMVYFVWVDFLSLSSPHPSQTDSFPMAIQPDPCPLASLCIIRARAIVMQSSLG